MATLVRSTKQVNPPLESHCHRPTFAGVGVNIGAGVVVGEGVSVGREGVVAGKGVPAVLDPPQPEMMSKNKRRNVNRIFGIVKVPPLPGFTFRQGIPPGKAWKKDLRAHLAKTSEVFDLFPPPQQ